jgi:hypothetical protein
MNNMMRYVTSFILLCTLQVALANEPQPATDKPPTEQANAQPASKEAAASNDQSSEAAAKKVIELREFTVRQLRARGYKLRNRDGKAVFCRKETSLGSRFEELVCFPASEAESMLKLETQRQLEMARRHRNCTGEGCSAN